MSDMATASWLGVKSPAAPKVSGQATAVDSSGRIFLFGGLTNGAGSPCTNEVWTFANGEWQQVETLNKGPGPRMYAAAGMLGNSMYVFGGWDPEAPGSGGTFKDEIWRLDLDKMEWSQMEAIPFGPVSRHCACTVGSRIVVNTFRGVFTLEADGQVIERASEGDAPVGLSMQACSPLGEDAMLIFGGATKTQQMTANVWRLDTSSWKWTKLQVQGEPMPTPRGSSCAAPFGDDAILVFGGAGMGSDGYGSGKGLVPYNETWLLRVGGDVATWNAVDTGASAPTARVAASLSPLPNGKAFLMQGGWDPKSGATFDEPMMLTL